MVPSIVILNLPPPPIPLGLMPTLLPLPCDFQLPLLPLLYSPYPLFSTPPFPFLPTPVIKTV